ncbi:MAG: coproporphyrinogen III oxidase, partial [Myxococcales bacterium]|nr:coproporphyrinogen III oxidase [Myxococcales bacterium]
MTRTRSQTATATAAIALVEALQTHFKTSLETLATALVPDHPPLAAVEWLRDEGRHGGGMRYVAVETPVFNRVAINISHVHYEDLPDKRLRSATALSTIIHPHNPRAASMHMHISWTELADGEGYWRMMADLNPSIVDKNDRDAFAAALREAAPALYPRAAAEGDRYFFIPALERHRGVTHFYLESYSSGDFEADLAQAERLGRAVIDRYVALIAAACQVHPVISEDDQARQIYYHTIYLLQVLTLDRGTTSGLLVHDQ